eukprot:TRINITY_DN5584_c0_g1_i1.p2 TRINITY_DN5584_c0_g1~~TRINITY_DN5584_c0_g1_i1.p2  ORF type:complete len:465 (+),score=165.17 TRINITY_DN5584_c0_g1_i1:58-1395(+)
MLCASLGLLAAAAVPQVNSTRRGSWCWTAPLPTGGRPARGTDFRGSYRDLSLYKVGHAEAPSHCHKFHQGPTWRPGTSGLWVLELTSAAEAAKAERTVASAGVKVLLKHNASLVVQGGEELPDRTGYDACGAEPGVAVIPVPDHTVRLPLSMRAAELTRVRSRTAKTNPTIADAVSRVSEANAAANIEALQTHNSRNSYSPDLKDAQVWLEGEFEKYGFAVTRFPFRDDMPPCVVAELKGKQADKIIVAGAHYDSRSTDNTSPDQRAPGADDNASGTSALLEIARVIKEMGLKLEYTLRLVAFSGEEQGLLGSRALAQHYAETNVDVVTMFNADMLGWQIPGQPITLGFKDRYISEETTEVVRGLVSQYVPGMPTEYSASCCSDYLSFHENGFVAVGFFENAVAASSYPHYHKSTDLLQYVNTEQLTLETKGFLASVLTFTGIEE